MTQSVSEDSFRSDRRGQTVFEDDDEDEDDYEMIGVARPSPSSSSHY
jgi:hypothetical protein